jgi:hypothetical protein
MVEGLKEDTNLIIHIDERPALLEGFRFKDPEVMLGNNKRLPIRNGSMNLRERIL